MGSDNTAAPTTTAVDARPPRASEPEIDAATSVETATPVATPIPPSAWETDRTRTVRRWTSRSADVVVMLRWCHPEQGGSAGRGALQWGRPGSRGRRR